MAIETLWEYDGGGSHNPKPDWWHAHTLKNVAGHLMYVTHPGGSTKKREITTSDELIEIAGRMGMDDETLEKALGILEGRTAEAV